VPSRLGRCLLDIDDRVIGDAFPLTHQHMANLIAANRTTVSLATASLQRGPCWNGSGSQISQRPKGIAGSELRHGSSKVRVVEKGAVTIKSPRLRKPVGANEKVGHGAAA